MTEALKPNQEIRYVTKFDELVVFPKSQQAAACLVIAKDFLVIQDRIMVPAIISVAMTEPSSSLIELENLCDRCIKRDKNRKDCIKNDKDFFCDVGMKSVLRAIRRHFKDILKTKKMKVPKGRNSVDWPDSFKAACLALYLEDVLSFVGALEPLVISTTDEAINVNQVMQFFLDNAE